MKLLGHNKGNHLQNLGVGKVSQTGHQGNTLKWKDWQVLLFIRSVMSSSLRPHGLQHSWLPCPSLSPRVCQTHVCWVGDPIQPSHPLSPPSPPALNFSHHQSLFQRVGSLHQVASGTGASASASVTIGSDFGAQKDKVCHCFLFFLLFALKWWDQMPWC